MRKTILFAITLLLAISIRAQESSNRLAQETFNQNRYSLSVLTLNAVTGHDAELQSWVNSLVSYGKFDMNVIPSKKVSTSSDAILIKEALMEQNVGKQVLNYWLQYDGTKFNSKLLENRSRYNAKDEDVFLDNASKVKTLNVANKDLMKKSFVLVIGPTSVQTKTIQGKKSLSVKVDAYVYQVKLNETVLAQVWDNWLDSEATKEQKMFYDNIKVDLDFEAVVKGKEGYGSSISDALTWALSQIYPLLEKKIEEWQPVTTIYQKKPIGAKIGKKEGLKNSDRYSVFKVVENQNGELEHKKVGFVRATKVVNNATNASGNSECSHFYQISGNTVKEGMYLKEKKDSRVVVSAYGSFTGYVKGGVDVDYLAHTSRTGNMQYVGLSLGYDQSQVNSNSKIIYFPISFNYGIGIHLTRLLEILPTIGVGADFCKLQNSSVATEESMGTGTMAFWGHGGVKVGFQIFYPVQLFVKADYPFKISAGKSYVESVDHKRFGEICLSAGLKINF